MHDLAVLDAVEQRPFELGKLWLNFFVLFLSEFLELSAVFFNQLLVMLKILTQFLEFPVSVYQGYKAAMLFAELLKLGLIRYGVGRLKA